MEGDRDGKSSLRRVFRVSAEDTWEEIPVGQARPLSGVRAGLAPFKFPFLIVRQRWGKEHAVWNIVGGPYCVSRKKRQSS